MPQSTTISHRDETARLQSLVQYEILDTPPHPALDEITSLAARIFHVPFAYIGFLDANRLWFKSIAGFSMSEMPRATSACQYTILDSQSTMVDDTANDARFPSGKIPLGEDVACRSYLGVPLITPSGDILGTLAVLSPEPGAFRVEDASVLETLGRQVITRLEFEKSKNQGDQTSRARQRVERALTVERNFVSAILDTVGALVLVLDTTGRVVRYNRVCERISGYTFADLVDGYLPEDLLLPEERAQARELFKDACAGRIQNSYELHWACRDGRCRRIAWTATALRDALGEVNFVITTGVDVTEQRRLDRMKDEFISTVSHELRTPLTSLRAALGLIAGGTLANRPEKMEQMFDVAVGNCERLVRVVNEILDFERIGSGSQPLEHAEISAVDLLNRASELLHASAQGAGITLHIDAEPVSLWVDGDRILQTLTNLLGNAIKFSPRGSEIRLRAHSFSESETMLEVRDQGRGIPPEKLDAIFERFQPADASDSRAGSGTGLGLALCRSIVHQHKGRIWAESTVGKGSSFFITLPRRAPEGLLA
jgi:PAS domain S-box-containing protein